MKTIQMTIDEVLLARVNQVTRSRGITRSAFIREALEHALHRLAMIEFEREHIAGYERYPVKAGEFDVWESEQA